MPSGAGIVEFGDKAEGGFEDHICWATSADAIGDLGDRLAVPATCGDAREFIESIHPEARTISSIVYRTRSSAYTGVTSDRSASHESTGHAPRGCSTHTASAASSVNPPAKHRIDTAVALGFREQVALQAIVAITVAGEAAGRPESWESAKWNDSRRSRSARSPRKPRLRRRVRFQRNSLEPAATSTDQYLPNRS